MSVFILENVSKSFKVDKKENLVLDNINLELPEKGFVSIVGKSGSGKSTLLNLLMGIEKPSKGKILFKGNNISKFNDKKYSRYHLYDISLIFQHYNLFDNLSVFENISLPLQMKSISKRKIGESVNKLLHELHIDYLSSQKVEKLSGGEKQRVAIARSLITNPCVIFCDEPTGALDPENGEQIMRILKQKSQKILIVMVSHNLELVKKYSDNIIELKDGKILQNSKNQKNTGFSTNSSEKRRYFGFWKFIFLKKNLLKNFLKNFISFLSCTLGFCAMFICCGFIIGSENSQNEALMKNLSITYSTISAIETVDLKDSPLTYQKTRRPELFELDDALDGVEGISVEENLAYYLTGSHSCSFFNETQTDFQLIPILDTSLETFGKDLLVQGSSSDNSFHEIIVNEEFINLFNNLKVNDEILFKNASSVTYNTLDEEMPFIQDELNIEQPFKIVGIIKEFPFLNSPKIYYSYKGAKDFLKNQIMENLSFYLGKRISYYDYLENAENDNEVTSYSSVIFITDLTQSEKYFTLVNSLKNSFIEISCSALEVKDTYKMFILSFSRTLGVFVGIAFIGINLILGMISLSTFIENRKNTAILTCLGSRNSSIYKIYLIENYILIGFAFISSLFLSNYLQNILNPLISVKFALSNLITIPYSSFVGIPYGLIIILASISILFSTIFALVPMSIYRHGLISEELRDE